MTRQAIISILKQTGLHAPLRWLAKDFPATLYTYYCKAVDRRGRRFRNYVKNHQIHKLHIGCGFSYLPGWFNTDLVPNRQREYLNATKPYPFPDNSFDYIFTEHMIEHVPYAAGQAMLAECFRVLKPGGVLRLVTPDLKFLMDLYQNQSQVAQDYVKWSANEFLKPPLPHNVTSVINNFFYDWGHRYIYDMPTMGAAMATIGFHQLTECQIGQSQHDALKGLDNDTRMPPGFLVLESMVIEAQKPDAKA